MESREIRLAISDGAAQNIPINYPRSGLTPKELELMNMKKREEEDNTKCSHQGYCGVWGNIWVAVATPVLIFAIVFLCFWLLWSIALYI